MKQQHQLKALVFDFGGVLMDLDMERCIRNFKILGVQHIDQYLGQYGQAGIFLQFEQGEISAVEFRQKVRALCLDGVTDDQIDAAWCSFLLDIPQNKLELLIQLRRKYRLYLLSNTNPIHIGYCEKEIFGPHHQTIHDYFDKCYFSYEMKLTKPGAAIFNKMIVDAGIEPEASLFIDDGLKNIEQAAAMGMQTYWLHIPDDLSSLQKLL